MSRSEELQALAQRVADGLPPDVIEVVLTGSVSRGVADEVSDIEMLCVTERSLSLEEAFELARRAGLEERDSWGDPSTPTRRVFGYLEGTPVETIWWSRELAEELFATGGSAEAIANGVALRTSGLLPRWQERLADYPDELVAERVEKAAERWGGFAPEGLLTIVHENGPSSFKVVANVPTKRSARTLAIDEKSKPLVAIRRSWYHQSVPLPTI